MVALLDPRETQAVFIGNNQNWIWFCLIFHHYATTSLSLAQSLKIVQMQIPNSNSGLRAEFHLLQESKDRTYVTTSKTDKPQGTEALSYIAQKPIQAWPEDSDIATDFPMMVVAESDDGWSLLNIT